MKKLYELITSLSKSEKRAINIRLGSNKKKSLLSQYFAVMSEMKEYDFEIIHTKVGKSINQTRSNLTLLYDTILKILRDCEISENLVNHCRGELIDVITLKSKGYENEAINRLNKLIPKAKEFENYEVAYEGLNELSNMHLNIQETSDEDFQKLDLDLQNTVEKLTEIAIFRSIHRKVKKKYFDFYFRKRQSNIIPGLDQILLEVVYLKKTCKRTEFLYFDIQAMIYLMKRDFYHCHVMRKNQLLLVLSSKAFQNKLVEQMNVFSDVFEYLKINFQINEFKAYHNLFKSKYEPLSLQNNSSGNELYSKTIIVNECYIALIEQDEKYLKNILVRAYNYTKQDIITSSNAKMEMYIMLIGTFLCLGLYKKATTLFIDAFSIEGVNKSSNVYRNLEILFICQKILLKDITLAENLLRSFFSRNKRNNIEISEELVYFSEVLKSFIKTSSFNINEFEIKLRNAYHFRILIHKLSNLSINSYISSKIETSNLTSDYYLATVSKMIA